jgi:hypothetical protein
MESMGFKEWALVCVALGAGKQSVILRKGGIAEGRAGFEFQHREFFLFPTYFHEQVERLGGERPVLLPAREGKIEISFAAELDESAMLTSWDSVVALEPLHILQREVVRERFEYNERSSIHVGFVRVFRLATPWIIPDLPAYGGCRSWVKLPSAGERIELRPVLSDEEHAARLKEFRAIVGDAEKS